MKCMLKLKEGGSYVKSFIGRSAGCDAEAAVLDSHRAELIAIGLSATCCTSVPLPLYSLFKPGYLNPDASGKTTFQGVSILKG